VSIRAILFDMDGVLVDSEPVHARAWQTVLAELGIGMDDAWFRQWIGIIDADLIHHVAARWPLPVSPAEALERKHRAYYDLVRREMVPFPGLMGLLDRLDGIPVATVTSSDTADALLVLEHTRLLGRMRFVISREDVPRRKPAPDAYIEAARRLGLPPASCAVLEDSRAGIAAGKAAGCLVFAIASSHPPEELDEADACFPTTVAALEHLFEELILQP
jgi:HAD superfamily hydrolase (TIGR01509 family)